MAAEPITNAVFGEIRRLISLRPSYATDNTVGPGEPGAASTWTVTFTYDLATNEWTENFATT